MLKRDLINYKLDTSFANKGICKIIFDELEEEFEIDDDSWIKI